ncbi:MAG: hypothetical protein AABX17_02400 [Nanoarchaeota archaeon]
MGDRIMKKKSQVTVFVIIAIIIVAILLIVFYQPLKGLFVGTTTENFVPSTCIQNAVKEAVNLTMSHGGKINPTLFFRYNNQTLDYLCYTMDWYRTCVMQNPLLKQSIEAEAQEYSQKKIDDCFNSAFSKLESKGYNLQISGTRKAVISLEPGKIVVKPDMSISITRAEEPKKIVGSDNLLTEIKSNSYDIVMIASSIQNFEARYGDSVIDSYMAIYPNIRIEKIKQSDGTKVYIISDRNTKEILQFATRSLAWPPGLATGV